MVAGLNENGERYLAVIIICPTIAVTATALRLWCKAVTMKNGINSFHADDWCILATTISYLGAVSAVWWGLFAGSHGMEIGEITKELMASPTPEKLHRVENYLEGLFVGNTILYLTFFLAKMSICLLYRRIFATQQFRRVCLIFMGIATAWFIAAEVVNLVMCIPIDAFWHRMKPGKCLNFNMFSLGIGIADILLDTAILILPVRAVLSLQMPTKTKVMVSGIFLLGGFAVITSILRVAYQYQPHGVYVSFSKAEVWLNIHSSITILCACLPVYKPIRDIAGKFIHSIRDKYSSSARFRSAGSGGRARLGSSKGSTDGSNSGQANREQKGVYPTYMAYHYPTKETSSTRELVLTPPSYGGPHLSVARWSETSGDEYPLTIPPRGIARTTRVEVV